MPANQSPFYDGGWVAAAKFQASGYVSADDAASLDAGLLSTLQETEQRRGSGIDIIGWAEAPHFDPPTHTLYWAIDANTPNGRILQLPNACAGPRWRAFHKRACANREPGNGAGLGAVSARRRELQSRVSLRGLSMGRPSRRRRHDRTDHRPTAGAARIRRSDFGIRIPNGPGRAGAARTGASLGRARAVELARRVCGDVHRAWILVEPRQSRLGA